MASVIEDLSRSGTDRGLFYGGAFQGAAHGGKIRVLNPATGDYVRNAEVTTRQGALIAISDENGTYTLRDVPAGTVTVEVSYPTFLLLFRHFDQQIFFISVCH